MKVVNEIIKLYLPIFVIFIELSFSSENPLLLGGAACMMEQANYSHMQHFTSFLR